MDGVDQESVSLNSENVNQQPSKINRYAGT